MTIHVVDEVVVRAQMKVFNVLSLQLSPKLCCLAGRKRRRSMSPYERDRYEPRPRYNDDYGLQNLTLG